MTSEWADVTEAPQVSVVMPVYNGMEFVAEAIASVQGQSFQNWELLAVDDGSTDGSLALLHDLAQADRRIRVLAGAVNQGPGPTRSLGMAQAQGRYIAFLDADDLWHPAKLMRQIGWMQAEKHVFSCTAYHSQRYGFPIGGYGGRAHPRDAKPAVADEHGRMFDRNL